MAGLLSELTHDGGRPAPALTIPDREAILRVLDDPPDELGELRGVLLRSTSGEHARASASLRSPGTNGDQAF
jgi:hypothetical protein